MAFLNNTNKPLSAKHELREDKYVPAPFPRNKLVSRDFSVLYFFLSTTCESIDNNPPSLEGTWKEMCSEKIWDIKQQHGSNEFYMTMTAPSRYAEGHLDFPTSAGEWIAYVHFHPENVVPSSNCTRLAFSHGDMLIKLN